MNREIRGGLPSPGRKDEQLPLLLREFLVLIREYLDTVVTAHQDLLEIAELFHIGQKPDTKRREFAAGKLFSMQEPIQALRELLDTAARLPTSVISFRYPLVAALCRVDEQIYAISRLISALGAICNITSPVVVRRHQSLRQELESLLDSSEEVIHLAHDLIDQVRFEERKLTQLFPSKEQYLPYRMSSTSSFHLLHQQED